MPKRNASKSVTFPPSRQQWRLLEELVLWLAVATIAYSILVPLVAFESLASAEFFLRFTAVHQVMMFGVILVTSFLLANRILLKRWSHSCAAGVVGLLLITFSLQPSSGCCSAVAAYCAGMLPADEVSASDFVFHLLPILGSVLVIIQTQASRSSQRAE